MRNFILILIMAIGHLTVNAQATERVNDEYTQPVIPMEADSNDMSNAIVHVKSTSRIPNDTVSDIPFIVFHHNDLDLGHITNGDKVTCIYRFINRSWENWAIDYVQTNACFEVDYSKMTIEPGAMGYVRLTFFTSLISELNENTQKIIVTFKSKDKSKQAAGNILPETLSLKAFIDKVENIEEVYSSKAPYLNTY